MKKLLTLLLVLQTSIGFSQWYSYTYGCTDPSSTNYLGTSDAYDYGECCYETSMRVVYNEGCYVNISSLSNGVSTEFLSEELLGIACLPDGCYNVFIQALGFGQFNFELSDGQVFNYTLQDESFNFQFTIGELISGCNDYTACNYTPNVNCELEECIYDCIGCTDPLAENYDPNATIDSGACVVDTYTLNTSSDVQWFIGNQEGTTVDGIAQFTVNGECNFLQVYVSDLGEQASYFITNGNGDLVTEGVTSAEYYPTNIYLCFDNLIGCTDINACNYNADAVCSDYFICEYDCYGCTDVNALNYDPSAQIDNGSCCFESLTFVVTGEAYISCIEVDHGAANNGQGESSFDLCYHEGCVIVDCPTGSSNPFSVSIYNSQGDLLHTEEAVFSGWDYQMYFLFSDLAVPGCSDPFACNYDPEATCYDYSCDYSCLGCTDPSAPNYNADATIENGTCCIDSWFTFEFSEPCFWYVQNISTGLFASGNYPEDNGFCASQFTFPTVPQMPTFDEHLSSYFDRSSADCFAFGAYGLSGNLLDYTLYDNNGQVIASSSAENGLVSIEVVSNSEDVSGCMDMNACNYNPSATCHSGNCEYECGGCTDNSAFNYSPTAQWEDGTCFYTLQAPEITFQIVNEDNGTSYSVIFTINDFGNGEQYIISNDYNTDQVITSGSNTYEIGPFACFSEINIKFRSTIYDLIEYLNVGPISHDCMIISTSELETEQTFGLYPNPSVGGITLTGLDNMAYMIQVVDLTGRVVYQRELVGQTEGVQLSLDHLSDGYYILQLSGPGIQMNDTMVIRK